MIIALKVILGIILITLLFIASFRPVTEVSRKKKLLILGGFVPYIFITSMLFIFLSRMLLPNRSTAQEIGMLYSMLFILPYLIFALRLSFNSLFSSGFNSLIQKGKIPHSSKELTHFVFTFHSIGLFVGGIVIVVGISIRDIPDASDNFKKPLKPIEKWLFISDNNNDLNQVSNDLFNFNQIRKSDTIIYLFYDDDDFTGRMISRKDSININYSYSIDSLKMSHDNKSWAFHIISKSENEMIVSSTDCSSTKRFIKAY